LKEAISDNSGTKGGKRKRERERERERGRGREREREAEATRAHVVLINT